MPHGLSHPKDIFTYVLLMILMKILVALVTLFIVHLGDVKLLGTSTGMLRVETLLLCISGDKILASLPDISVCVHE